MTLQAYEYVEDETGAGLKPATKTEDELWYKKKDVDELLEQIANKYNLTVTPK